MKHVKINGTDKLAIVDDEDYERIAKFNWSLVKSYNITYAKRAHYIGNGKVTTVLLHQEVMKTFRTGIKIDHRNGNGLDCQKGNLRHATSKQNQANIPPNITNKTGFKGVHYDSKRGKYCASIRINGRKTNLGRFDNPTDAAKAYDSAATKEFGEFAWTNF